MSPTVIAGLIRAELAALIDPTLWRRSLPMEKGNRRLLSKVAKNWAKVESSLRGGAATP